MKKLTGSEEYAINQYISSVSYIINGKLRDGIPLTDEENSIIINLDKALEKMPNYQGDLTRSLYFDNEDDLKSFLKNHKPGNIVEYEQYISATYGEIYNPDGQIQLLIVNSSRGNDISKYNSAESEVLYKRKSKFRILEYQKNNNTHYIKMEEADYE